MLRVLLLLLILLLPLTLVGDPLPRRILTFWDGCCDNVVEDSLVHRTLEMPLNHLGLDVIYHDIKKPLPSITEHDEFLGILICFAEKTVMEEPEKFIEWVINAVDSGKKLVLMGNYGFGSSVSGESVSVDLQNKLFEKLGFTYSETLVDYPYDYQVVQLDTSLLDFEKKIPTILTPFYQTKVNDPRAKSYLKVAIPGKAESATDLVIINPNGGFTAFGYSNYFDPLEFTSSPRSLGWYVNPFKFFERAFGLTGRPIPDITTLGGRRIFISVCHGDDFNAETAIEEYKDQDVYCGEAILEKVIKTNPDIPVAVGFVAADFDPKWAMKEKSQSLLKRYLDLPQVEAASHTYSHPFSWEFFHTGGPEKEISFLELYPYGSWQSSYISMFNAKMYQIFRPTEYAKKIKWGYVKPREYANEKFDVEKEIGGSIDYLNQFAPENNKIKLLIWSGDSRPWDVPALLTQKAKVNNFGGGYVRFDGEHPSILFVYPICRKPGGVIQPYTSANGDNDYTNEWTERFYAFQFLTQTLINTEKPRRLKPITLYYHSFSGQFTESVNAILKNIEFIRTQMPIAIHNGRFCQIAEGFYNIKIEPAGEKTWIIRDRLGLQTLRFDDPGESVVDFAHSEGVIGYRKHQDSLYIYLDAAVQSPLVAMKERDKEEIPYLIESSWEVRDLKRDQSELSFKTSGWGKLSMQWNVGKEGSYLVSTTSIPQTLQLTAPQGVLTIEVDLPFNKIEEISIKKQ